MNKLTPGQRYLRILRGPYVSVGFLRADLEPDKMHGRCCLMLSFATDVDGCREGQLTIVSRRLSTGQEIFSMTFDGIIPCAEALTVSGNFLDVALRGEKLSHSREIKRHVQDGNQILILSMSAPGKFSKLLSAAPAVITVDASFTSNILERVAQSTRPSLTVIKGGRK